MEKTSWFLTGLIFIFAALSFLLIKKYLIYVLSAIIVAYLSYPIYKFLQSKIGNKTVSSLTTLLLVLVFAVTPFLIVTHVVYSQAGTVLRSTSDFSLDRFKIDSLEEKIKQLTGKDFDLRGKIKSSFEGIGSTISSNLVNFVFNVKDFLIGIFIMIFVIFYLYKDGELVFGKLKSFIPLKDGNKDELFKELKQVTNGIFKGHMLTALVQGVVAAIGFFIFGIPNPVFWGFIVLILALLPIIGPFLIYIPAAAFYIIQNSMFIGLGLLIYGLVVVELVDNLVRPKLISHESKVHPVIVLLGIFGGLSIFGVAGIFIGPIIIAIFVALLRFWREEFLESN